MRDERITIEKRAINTDFVRIDNRDQFITKIPDYHPDDPRYRVFWSREIKRCLEGRWGKMFGGYRYMRGTTYFYANYVFIEETDKQKRTSYIKPNIDDLEWEISYYVGVARGFSGFAKDEEVTCLAPVKDYLDGTSFFEIDYLKKHYPSAFNKKGILKRYVDPHDYIRQIHKKPLGRALYENQTHNGVVAGSRGGGKAGPLNSLILSEKGWVTMGSLKVGDSIYSRNGSLCSVTDIFPQGAKEIFEVHLQDGRIAECCEDHLWLVRQVKNGGKMGVLSVKEMMSKGISNPGKRGCTWKYQIPINDPIAYPTRDLPIDPYVLGCLLSDGTLTTLTPKIAVSDPFVLEKIRSRLPDFEIKHDPSTTNNHTIVDRNKKYRTITRKNGTVYQMRAGNRLTARLRELGLDVKGGDKHIPEIYLRASQQQRMELLQGFMDSDGHILKGGHAEFTNNSERLIDDVAQLCRSLGIRCQKSIDNRAGEAHEIKGHHFFRGVTYRLYINTSKQIASSPEKVDRLRDKPETNSQSFVSIVDIVATGRYTEMQCITVDSPDHTYIMDDHIVTHNSYFMAGELEHALLFDGATSYDDSFLDGLLTVSVCIGSGDSDKSSELVGKIVASIGAKADFKLSKKLNIGVFREEIINSRGERQEIIKPIPIFRDFKGSTIAPNKKNPLRYRYDKLVAGRWVEQGTGSRMYHVNYSDKKADGAQAGAGGRYLLSLIEEAGLSQNLTEINRSNDSAVARDGIRFGSEFYIGTSGNLMKAVGLRRMMENPQDYSVYPLDNQYGTQGKDGKVGFFLPFYMTLRQFKDENGNTDFKTAASYVEKIRKDKAKSSDPEALRKEKMNRPCWIDEMWLSLDGNIMPYAELDDREKELRAFNLYERLEKPVNLIWDHNELYGVRYEIDMTLEPYRDFPINASKRNKTQGCVVLYDLPQYVDGVIPEDMYIFVGHDPYVEEDIDRGGSIGSTYVLMNPKYAGNGLKGGTIVAAYNDKPVEGLDRYYDNQAKLIALYGGNPRALWFEKNRGEYCRSYYVAKHKAHLLAPTPQWTQSTNMYQRRITSYGYTVGNRLRKMELAKVMSDWLLEETSLDDGVKKNVARLPDLFLIQQLKSYNLDDNFDAVDGFRGCIVGLREYQRMQESEMVRTSNNRERKALSFYLNNPRIFKHGRQ